MSTVDDYHPELKWMARLLPHDMVGPRTIRFARALSAVLCAHRGDRRVPAVTMPTGARVRLFRPAERGFPVPALLWMHGGGFVFGGAAFDDALCASFSETLGIVVASVEYRLAPEHPFPAARDDCYRALTGLAQLPDVDETRLAIGGASAGGGLAAELALLCRDRDELRPIFQLLLYPMLDDRTRASSPEFARKVRLWNESSNRFGWLSYLGDADPNEAAPARCQDLSGLSPAWLGAGTLDLLHSEGMAYAQRLRAAGVPCELKEVPGAFHSFDAFAARTEVARDFFRSQVASLAKHLRLEIDPQVTG